MKKILAVAVLMVVGFFAVADEYDQFIDLTKGYATRGLEFSEKTEMFLNSKLEYLEYQKTYIQQVLNLNLDGSPFTKQDIKKTDAEIKKTKDELNQIFKTKRMLMGNLS